MHSTPMHHAPASPSAQRFELMRSYSITSLVGIVLVTACLFYIYREISLRHLVDHENRANTALTVAIANANWDEHRDFVLRSAGQSREELLADPGLQHLRRDVRRKTQGLKIAKIKIYNVEGLTVFSTHEQQIGESVRNSQPFREALAGRAVSGISYRESFDALDGPMRNLFLLATYAPTRVAPGAPVEGVFEVYSDVTELMQQRSQAQWQVAGLVLGMLVSLYMFLFFVVRRAARIIAQQAHEQSEREHEIRHRADHDALTGLPNRASLTERLEQTLANAKRTRRRAALLFVDLDRFKIVNDSLGHDAGDALLKQVATRLQSCLRGSDTVFRVGGDEFTIVLPEVAAADDGARVARRVIDAVSKPMTLRGQEVSVGATIGIALFPEDGNSAEGLIQNADAAMYDAKAGGPGRYAHYRAEMNEHATRRLELRAALHKAHQDGEFALYYQPRVDARTRRVVAFEALLRWISPSRGVVAPGEFIPELEETGLMLKVGEWVLHSACAQAEQWRREGFEPLRISVNVSALQFQSQDFLPMVRRALAQSGIEPTLVELEMTESLLIGNVEQARITIAALKALGLSISIDDFGTGFSSLNYLRHFDIDYLKIDRSFTTKLATDARARAVATAIADLARALHMSVVAEGVETEAQAEFYRSIQCSELQGYLFCKPLPADQVRSYLTTTHTPARVTPTPQPPSDALAIRGELQAG